MGADSLNPDKSMGLAHIGAFLLFEKRLDLRPKVSIEVMSEQNNSDFI